MRSLPNWNSSGIAVLVLVCLVCGANLDAGDSSADIYRNEIEALLKIASRGNEAAIQEKDVLARAKPSFLGTWLAPWVYHTLTQIVSKPEERLPDLLKHIADNPGYVENTGTGRQIVIPHGDVKEAPPLPPELSELSEKVWETYFCALRRLYEKNREEFNADYFSDKIRATCAPSNTLLRIARAWFHDQGNDPSIRAAAGFLMGCCGHQDPSVTRELVDALKSPELVMRIMCAKGLGRQAYRYEPFGDHQLEPTHPCPGEAARALVGLLNAPEFELRIAAIEGLSLLAWQAREAGRALMEFGTKATGDEREATFEAMARIGAPELTEPLLEMLRRAQDKKERVEAMYCLAEFGRNLSASRCPDAPAICKKILPVFFSMSKNEHAPARVAYCIGMYGPYMAEAVPLLEELLGRLSSDVKEDKDEIDWSIWALGQIGPSAAPAVPKILKLTTDPNMKSYLFRCAEALGNIGVSSPEITSFLLSQTATAERDYYRSLATRALGQVGQPTQQVLARLRELDRDSSMRVRWEAERALKALESKAASGKKANDY